MTNTTVTIKYANGSTREFVASDELEKLINEGEMFSVTTMHSDMGIEEEMSVSKMYAGNPVAAMGHMMMMKHNAEKLTKEEHSGIIVDVVTACIGLLSNEITSHQSGMSPVVIRIEEHSIWKDEADNHYRVLKVDSFESNNVVRYENTHNGEAGSMSVNDWCSVMTKVDISTEERKDCHVMGMPCDHLSQRTQLDSEVMQDHCSHPETSGKDGECTAHTCPFSEDFIPF